MKKIIAKHTCIEIHDYNVGDSTDLENSLGVYDKARFKMDYIGLHYDPKTKILRVPRGISINFLETEFNTQVNIDHDYDNAEKSKFKLNTMPRDEQQKEAIAFLLGKGNHIGTKGYSRVMLNLNTGKGKTYCTIAASYHSGVKIGIIVNTNDLMEQWEKKIYEYTNISHYDIHKVSGSKSVNKILDGKTSKAKVFIISHRTIHEYARQHGWNKISEVFDRMGIGIKVYDECHKEFHNMVMIDLYTNTKKTIYLTATAGRSSRTENVVFGRVFSNIPSFAINTTIEDNHINMMILKYNSNPSFVQESSMKTKFGFNMMKYMDYCVEGKGRVKFFNAIKVIIDTIKDRMDENSKIAIYVLKRSAAREVKHYIEENYPEFIGNIGLYTSDVVGADKTCELDNKVIVTTTKSMGTGSDVDGLRYLIMCEPYSSKITAKQVTGRLRDIGGEIYYFEVIDVGFKSCREQFSTRKPMLLKRAKKFTIVDLDPK